MSGPQYPDDSLTLPPDVPPGKLVIEVDLGSLIVSEEGEPQFLPDVILDRAAVKLLDGCRDVVRSFDHRTRQLAEEEIREMLRPLIAEALVVQMQPTNRLGEAKGEPTTLREHIVKEAAAALTVRDRGRTGGGSLLEDVIRKEVETALRRELQEAVEEGRKTVLAAVRDQAAAVITETIDRVTRR